jgi:PAS domain S-box-containing protein
MHPYAIQMGASFLLATGLAAWVGLRREKAPVHWILLALLLALGVWTAGTAARFSARSEQGVRLAVTALMLGPIAVPPLWLLLAARYVRLRALEGRAELVALLLAPSVLAYLGVLTNAEHELFFRGVLPVGRPPGAALTWAGPLFWAFLAWGYFCMLCASAIYLDAARRLPERRARRRATLLGAMALVPVAASGLHLVRLLPTTHDPTPSAFALALGIMLISVFRNNASEALPLARRDVVEQLDDGVVVTDPEGVVIDTNPAARRFLGWTPADGPVSAEALLARRLDAEAAHELAVRLARLGADAPPLTREHDASGGRRVQLVAACVRGRDGEPAGRFLMLRDCTEERRYERFVRRTQKLESVGILASGIAHEVNNPLAFVRANLAHLESVADLLKRRLDRFEPEEAAEVSELAAIVAETQIGIERIRTIVGSLRRFSRMQEAERVEVDVNAIALEAVKLAELHRNRAVCVETRLAPEPARVSGSPERLLQAVVNLLINAKQALGGRPQGRIQVETRREGRNVEIRVADDGPGIPEEIQDRIFDPFFTTKGPDEGTGLGLSIAFDIVREHGGVLDATSRPGEGACFVARIPASS